MCIAREVSSKMFYDEISDAAPRDKVSRNIYY